MIKYTADVKALLRASGMSDVDILEAEIGGNQDLLRIVAAMFPRPICPDERELKRLEAQVGREVLEAMGLKCAPELRACDETVEQCRDEAAPSSEAHRI